MGIMAKWREWSQWLYDKYVSKFQSQYDRFRKTKTPEWYLKLTDKVWEHLDDGAKDFLNVLISETIARFDEEFAKELIEKIVAMFKKRLAVK